MGHRSRTVRTAPDRPTTAVTTPKPVAVAASWEIHARDFALHAVLTDGKLETGVGPHPGKPDLVITANLADDELASYRAIVRAAKSGRVDVSCRRKLLDTFLRVFTVPAA
ncbi:hypothetical protein C8D87_101612 [Lentzea atacamensis]|uniref:SCP-2 sterol transfer family protein n=1 Tax=Lentzea atacamensis TaxID=531938 RepID=A0ABX9EGJ6_9PSEU|nr:hypothetical protein C8D87_101612 [Lentzea atacamensis]